MNMADSSRREKEDAPPANIFRIADELVDQVDKTKKYVVIMIIAVIVAIPVSWHVSPVLLGTPYNFMLAGVVTIVIAISFLVVGIRQWTVLSKWTKRYKSYKKLQEEVDAKLDFEGAGPTDDTKTK
jgi:hypothetical protein